MNHATSFDPSACAAVWDEVRALRHALGETGEQFGQRIGLSKSKVSELEAGKYPPSVATALAIEALSAAVPGMAIDAACLCEDVKLSRHGFPVTADVVQSATGQAGQLSGGPSTGSGRAEAGVCHPPAAARPSTGSGRAGSGEQAEAAE